MEIVDQSPTATEPAAQGHEYPWWRVVLNRLWLETWHWRLKRWVPRLVWLNDQVDVTLTFSADKLNPEDPFRSLFSGELYEIEKRFRAMGISFDTGIGGCGRDWEWDWSLSGPVSIRFRGRAKRPELRKEPIRPMLVFSRKST